MKNQMRFLFSGALALLLSAPVIAQQPSTGTAITKTTLSQTITATQSTFAVASVTGCPSTGTFNRVSNPCDVVVEGEHMSVVSISGKYITVLRGVLGTAAVGHVSGEFVYFGSPTAFPSLAAIPSNAYDTSYTQFLTFPTTVAPNQVTDVSGTEWYSQIYIPKSTILTGACQMNGNGTLADNMLFILWDRLGNVLANTAVAGVTQSGTSVYQCQAFLNAVAVPGPGVYFIGVQGNGTTAASIATYAAGSVPTGYATGSQTGTFGTVAAITTVPTTFTANKGPVMSVY
ncbi:MAG TPA: hypothetical protein VGR96_15900 [Acidobacteriaceae bacterium]|nr:hypothetical protein [Acidobacteriaceae bacterium]